jgi:hypothetical protein
MNFKIQNGLALTGLASAAVKQWPLGWTAGQAARGVARTTPGESRPRTTPGAFGLLVGVNRR